MNGLKQSLSLTSEQTRRKNQTENKSVHDLWCQMWEKWHFNMQCQGLKTKRALLAYILRLRTINFAYRL